MEAERHTEGACGWLARVFEHPRASAVVIALGALLSLPSVVVGFCTDDHAFRAFLKSRSPFRPPFYDLYRFTPADVPHDLLVRSGAVPWWSAPDFKLHLVRPLSSILFAFDNAVFGDRALGYHLHAIGWYVALLVVVGVLYRKILPGAAGGLSLLVFALKSAHVHAYAWVSARHILIAAVAAVLALIAQIRAREEGSSPGRWLAPLALAVGFLGGEAAMGGVMFVLAYGLAGPPATGGDFGWKRRLTECLPVILLAAGYLVLYRFLGGGAKGSGEYFDPLATPGPFIRAAFVRAPVLLGDALLGVPAELSDLMPAGPLALVGLIGVALFALLTFACFRRMSGVERTALRWLIPGAVGAVVVGVAGFPGGRLLVLSDVGFAALVGVLLRRGFEGGAGFSWRRGVTSLGVSLLVLLHIGIAPLLSLRSTRNLARLARATERVAHTAEIEASSGNRVFLVASDPMVFLYPRGIFGEESPEKIRCWSVLSAAKAPHRITRTGIQSFTLESVGRPLLEGPFEKLYRSPGRPFSVGDEARQCGATVRVVAVDQGKPTRLEIELDTPLDASDVTFLVWRAGRLRRLDLPPIGQSVDAPWNPGPSRYL